MLRVRAIAHTRPHLHPPVLRARERRRAGRRLHRRLPAVRRHRPPGPARARPHPRTGPPPVRLRAPPGGRAARAGPRSCPPTASARSAPPAPTGDATASTIGQEKRVNPALTQDEEAWVDRHARRTRRLPRLLRAHGPGQQRRPRSRRPVRPGGRRQGDPRQADRHRRVGRRPAHPHRIRCRSRHRHPELRTRRAVRHLPGLAHPLGHPPDPARRVARAGRRGPARARPHRHRPPGRRRHRRPGRLDRRRRSAPSDAPRSPTSPRSATTADGHRPGRPPRQ